MVELTYNPSCSPRPFTEAEIKALARTSPRNRNPHLHDLDSILFFGAGSRDATVSILPRLINAALRQTAQQKSLNLATIKRWSQATSRLIPLNLHSIKTFRILKSRIGGWPTFTIMSHRELFKRVANQNRVAI